MLIFVCTNLFAEDWKIFHHKSAGYEFKYPCEATIEKTKNPNMVYVVFTKSTTPHKKILFELRKYFYAKTFQEEADKVAEISCMADGPDGTSYCLKEDIKLNPIEINGIKGVKVERIRTYENYADAKKSKEKVPISYYLSINNKFLEIMEMGKTGIDLYEIVKTIKLKN